MYLAISLRYRGGTGLISRDTSTWGTNVLIVFSGRISLIPDSFAKEPSKGLLLDVFKE